MKILHLCLSCFYVDGFSYQENELARQNAEDGHDVLIIASTENYDANGQLVYGAPRRYIGTDQVPVIRLAYSGPFPQKLQRKLRIHPGVYDLIAEFVPDVILFHGACGWELNTAGRYVRNNPEVKLYVDSHEDFVNSARSFASKWLLHWAYYRPILLRNLRYVTKVLPVSISVVDFLRDFYGVPQEMLELYPLGGFVPDDEEYIRMRQRGRAKLELQPDHVLIVQSGKLDSSKKLIEALDAFRSVPDPAMQFAVAGRILPDIEATVADRLAKDPRVRLLGWQSPEDLKTILCAADVYCQPGTQSATMQMSIASRCAVILDDIPSHVPYMNESGWLVGRSTSIQDAFKQISADKPAVGRMAEHSLKVASYMLDYRLLAKRLYQHM